MRGSFVERRTAAANQLRAALAEFGIVAAAGKRGLSDLLALVETEAERFVLLPAALRLVLAELARQWRSCDEVVRRMDREIAASVKKSPRAMRLMFVPTIGPVGASAIDAMLPNPDVFDSGRHFAAFLGLTPREDSSGKTVRRGPITKKGDTYLRRVLVLGATSYLGGEGQGGGNPKPRISGFPPPLAPPQGGYRIHTSSSLVVGRACRRSAVAKPARRSARRRQPLAIVLGPGGR